MAKLTSVKCAMVLMFCGLCGSASAQAPNISSVGGAAPESYWSIYGSNLSSGSGSTVLLEYWAEDAYGWFWNQEYWNMYQIDQGYVWWYESSSQINTYIQASEIACGCISVASEGSLHVATNYWSNQVVVYW